MCQLTLFDIDSKTNFSKTLIRPLTELNILGINAGASHDGFGYMLFENPGKIEKVGQVATTYWKEHFDTFFNSVESANGIYHVRLASGLGNNKKVADENAHPFIHGNIVMAHNGTLREKINYFLDDEQQKIKQAFDFSWIDSEEFCFALNEICGDELLTAEHIKQAYDLFTGVFAFLIYDIRQPEKVFVVRGKTKKLHSLTIYDEDTPIGLILNTGLWELAYIGKLIKYTLNTHLEKNLRVGVSELKEESIYEYNIGSYSLDDPVEEIKETEAKDFVKPANKSVQPVYGWNRHNDFDRSGNESKVNYSSEVFGKIGELAIHLNFSMKELWILSEFVMDKNLTVFTLNDAEVFLEFLELIKKEKGYSGRIKRWVKAKNDLAVGALTIYKLSEISFPFILSTNSEIESCISTVNTALKKGG